MARAHTIDPIDARFLLRQMSKSGMHNHWAITMFSLKFNSNIQYFIKTLDNLRDIQRIIYHGECENG